MKNNGIFIITIKFDNIYKLLNNFEFICNLAHLSSRYLLLCIVKKKKHIHCSNWARWPSSQTASFMLHNRVYLNN